MGTSAQRLDNFTDAAFAISLSLLVIGRGDIPKTYQALVAAMADVPAFAIGFAILAMFWFGHVRWRRYRGEGGTLSVLLTFLLVFLVLVYVQPLQAMSASLSTYLGGSGTRFSGDLGGLFAIYGAGFTAMSATMAALFHEAARQQAAKAHTRIGARGETLMWLIHAATGLLSTLLSLVRATAPLAPFLYATLPLTIGLFTWRYPWPGPEQEPEAIADR
jgi:uncharacterized membrane protein